MNSDFNVFIRSILAGICIGLGGAIFIKLGGVIGACMIARSRLFTDQDC